MTCPISAPKRALLGSSLRRTVPRTRVRLGPPYQRSLDLESIDANPVPRPSMQGEGPKSRTGNTHPKGQTPVRHLTEYLHARDSRFGVAATGQTVRALACPAEPRRRQGHPGTYVRPVLRNYLKTPSSRGEGVVTEQEKIFDDFCSALKSFPLNLAFSPGRRDMCSPFHVLG